MVELRSLDPDTQYCDGNGLCLKHAARAVLKVCEICDTPERCRNGECPCDLCGEFIASVPVNVANHLLAMYRVAMNSGRIEDAIKDWQDLNSLSEAERPEGPRE